MLLQEPTRFLLLALALELLPLLLVQELLLASVPVLPWALPAFSARLPSLRLAWLLLAQELLAWLLAWLLASPQP